MSFKYRIKHLLVRLFAPIVQAIIYETPKIWGNKSRAHISNLSDITNALLNTQSGHISIGDYSFCGHHVMILTGSHDYTKTNKERMTKIPETGGDITIGQGVWIGSGATILGPSTIGDHAVIAAGSTVVAGTTVPAYSIYAGTPAKCIKVIER